MLKSVWILQDIDFEGMHETNGVALTREVAEAWKAELPSRKCYEIPLVNPKEAVVTNV